MNKEEKKIRLINIINDIANQTLLTEENKQYYIKELQKIYTDDFRHEYSEITGVLFSINSTEGRDYLAHKIKDMHEYVENKLGEDNEPLYSIEFRKSLRKLWDHINLEIIRMRELSRIAEDAAKASEKAINIEEKVNDSNSKMAEINKKILSINNKTKDFDKKMKGFNQNINGAKNQLAKLHKSVKSTTTEFITILSIFAAIVIGFTGGMSYITNAIISLNQIGPYRSGVFILLIGVIMFDIIFLLLYMIGKLTDRYIGSKGRCKNEKNGCSNKNIGCCIRRYPYVIWFNVVTFIIITTIINLYWIDRYDYLSKIYIYVFNDFKFIKLSFYLVLIFGVLFTYMPFALIIYKILNSKCKCETSQ